MAIEPTNETTVESRVYAGLVSHFTFAPTAFRQVAKGWPLRRTTLVTLTRIPTPKRTQSGLRRAADKLPFDPRGRAKLTRSNPKESSDRRSVPVPVII